MTTNESETLFAHFTPELDKELLLKANEVGKRARVNGDMPFGCLLADIDGNAILEAECHATRHNDPTEHAEVILAKTAVRKFGTEYLATCSAYVSGAPCAMCAGTLYWAGIGRIVTAINIEDQENRKHLSTDANPMLGTDFRDIFASGSRKVVIGGPYPELRDQIMARFAGYDFDS